MTLAEFILARIAEDEERAGSGWAARREQPRWIRSNEGQSILTPDAVLADCEAKRRIVEDFETLHADYQITHDPVTEARRFQAAVAMGHLAAVYADHSDYDTTWRP